ncbi:MAG: TRAM domain-containing protein [Phycisphaerales bacterium]|nr:TRAM domain-containing protein [Phycisphaerales bacterium]
MVQTAPQPLNPVEEARKRRQVLLRYVRALFLILLLTVTILAVLRIQRETGQTQLIWSDLWWIPMGLSVILGLGAILLDTLTPSKKLSTLSGIFLGLLAGLLATVALNYIIDLIAQTYHLVDPNDPTRGIPEIVAVVKVIVGIVLCYMGITVVLGTQDDFRVIIPYVELSRQIRGVRPLLLDSSVLIDGRLSDIGQTGFIQAPLVIPRFVLDELQRLADSGDRMKRQRGRRGLDILSRLHASPKLQVSIDETLIPDVVSVDQMLIELAGQLQAVIVTTDIALVKIARIKQVPVLNLNDLANAVKVNLLPGDHLTIELVRRGESAGQAVGYLDDGTMVVVDGGEPYIGDELAIRVTSSLQTSAGRMIFAVVPGNEARAAAADQPATPVTETAGDAPDSPASAQADPGDSRSGSAQHTPPQRADGPLGPGKKVAGRARTPRNPRRD